MVSLVRRFYQHPGCWRGTGASGLRAGWIFLLVVFLLPGCATSNWQPAETPLASEAAANAGESQWWRIRFRLTWPEDSAPDFSLHTLLADRVLAPLLDQHQQDISLWRFHRRASRDAAGHQFSLIFFGDGDLQDAFRDRLEGDPLLTALRREGVVEDVLFTGPDPRQEPIGVTSDPDWPEAIQDSWPWFIMGASRSWLDLVARVRAGRPDPGTTVAALRVEYREIDQAVNTLWGEEGYHAYLHHLNAVFGYQPLRNDRTGQWERF